MQSTRITAIILALTVPAFAAAQDLTVLGEGQGGVEPSKMLYEHLKQEAHAALEHRQQEYEQVKSVDDALAYQQRRREFFVRQLGGFPERTPLNAKTVGTLEGDGYQIEKVLFESRPNHHVTANFYLPTLGEPPFPAVAVSSGHSATGKAADYNQRFGIMMAKAGMAALCYDPVGQGERFQILGDDGKPKSNSTTGEHFQMGVGAILVGRNTATYRVYDAMRAIDYLVSRPEVDGSRIGFTGCSGGGTLTSYTMALDDRVLCAAPSCYLTTFGRLIDTIGPQDAEQNIFGQLAFGMDQPDYVLMRAPKPTLFSSTTGDFFDIHGTWENFRQAKRFYWIFGHPERVNLVEGPGGHGVPRGNLLAIARWMRRWLLGKDDPFTVSDLPVRTVQELQCTPQGQVLLLPEERSVFALNAERARELADQRATVWGSASADEKRQKVREVAGIRTLETLPKANVRALGTVKRDGYHIDKLVIETDGGVPLPVLAFVPQAAPKEAVLYLHGDGKAADAGAGGPIEQLVNDGRLVLAVDLPGIGETRGEGANPQMGDWKDFYMAYLLGKSMVGIRAESALVVARALHSRHEDMPIHLVAIGEAAVPALHAAALDPDVFASVRLVGMRSSWTEVVDAGETQNELVSTVHGVLAVYDLPDLVALCGEGKVTLEPAGGREQRGQ
jgi:dienelactone hydrolase